MSIGPILNGLFARKAEIEIAVEQRGFADPQLWADLRIEIYSSTRA